MYDKADQISDQYTTKFLLCFDTNFAIGPIPVEAVEKLDATGNFEIYIVSKSSYFPKNKDGTGKWPVFCEYPSKYLNLERCLKEFIDKNSRPPSAKFYVSGNADIKEAAKADFVYLSEKLFLQNLKDLNLMEK